MSDVTSLQRPKKVLMAVYLIILTILIELVDGIIKIVTKKTLESPSSLWDWAGYATFVIFITGFYTFYTIVLYKLSIGKKWARTTLLILVCLSLAHDLFEFLLYRDYLGNSITLIGTGLSIIALLLLFSKEANEWYNRNKITSEQIEV